MNQYQNKRYAHYFYSLFITINLSVLMLSTSLLTGCSGSATGSLSSETSLADSTQLITISPLTKTVALGGSISFTAAAGIEPYSFDVYYGNGSITSTGGTGNYQAPIAEGTAVVRVQDAAGNAGYATVEITDVPVIEPTSKTLAVNNKFPFAVLSGKAPYKFSIASGEGTINATTGLFTAANSAGTAVIRVTDVDGRSADANVTVNAALSFTAKTIYVEKNATYTLTATGGVAPYIYLLAAGAGTVDQATGIYTAPNILGSATIHVIDSLGNFDLATITINTSLSINPTSALIAKNSNLSFTTVGGVPPYSYAIQVGGVGTISALTGEYLAPAGTGTAIVRATDALGHTSDASITITNSISFSMPSLILAVGNSYDFSSIVNGGMAPLTYTVPSSQGIFTGSVYTAPNTPGVYTVTVSDSQTPTPNIVTTIVAVNSALVLLPIENTMVVGAQKSFSASGGVPPYTYSVQSGGGSIVNGLYTAPNVIGSAVILVTDARNNTATASVAIQAALAIIPTEKTLSSGEAFTFSASGGSTPYTFSLVSGSGAINSNTGLYTAPGSSGLATVRVEDANGNRQDAIITILNPLYISPPSISLIKSGAITFTASGGAAPYNFSVASGEGSVNATTGVFTASATPGSTIVRVTDSLGSIKDATVTIYNGLSISPFTKSLAVNQTFSFTANGGLIPYVYSLVSGVGSISNAGAYLSSTAGAAIVRVTDAAGNTSDATISISSALVINPTSKTLGINNQFTFGAIGGVPPYAFSVISGSGTITTAGDYKAPATSTSAVVRVTDSDGSTANATVTVNDALTISPVKATIAAGATQSFITAGGVGPYVYAVISGGGLFTNSTYSAASIASGASVAVVVTDALGNTANATITINPITVTIGSPNSTDLITSSNKAAFTLSGTCSESGRTVNISTTGGVSATPNCAGGVWSTILNLTAVADGVVTITATHANVNSVAATPAIVTLTKDGSSPTVTITTPTGGSYVGASLVVTGTCTKQGPITITVTGGISANTTCDSNSYSKALDISSTAEGALTITVAHTDNAGNAATPATVNITKDSIAPVITAFAVTNSSPTNTMTFNLTSAVTDSSTITQYCILENSTTLTNCSWQNGVLPSTFIVSATNNTKVLTAWVKDAASNVSAAINANSVILDNVVPAAPSALSLSSPSSSPGSVAAPTILVSGVSIGDSVSIYTDSSCLVGNQKGTASVGTGTSVTITSSALTAGSYTFYAKRITSVGNISACSTASVVYVLDLTVATITNVSASGNGPFKAGDTFTISVVFSKAVNVTGTPVLALTTTRTGAHASYSSGTTTGTLIFTYTTVSPDTTSDLTYTATSSLTLAGGMIKDTLGNNATLTLPTIGAAGSLSFNQQIVIDTTAPTSTTISVNGGAPYTTSITVPLTLAATGATEMYITNTAGCGSGGSYEAYATSRSSWALETANATNTVYAKFKNNVGNESSCVSDSIIHDATGPNAPTAVTVGSVPNSDSITPIFSWTAATDNAGGSGVVSYQAQVYKTSDNSVVAGCSWTNLVSGNSLTCTAAAFVNAIQYYMKVRAVDTAGNLGAESAASANWAATIYDACLESPTPGTTCAGGTIYIGSLGGYKYMTTPGNCTNSTTPTCNNSADSLMLAWANNSGTTAYGAAVTSAMTSLTDGVANTNMLANNYTDTDAAKYCQNMIYAGHEDWFFPAKDELNIIWTNRASLGNIGLNTSTNLKYYWSSSVTPTTGGWSQRFIDGAQYSNYAKNLLKNVRCVRKY